MSNDCDAYEETTPEMRAAINDAGWWPTGPYTYARNATPEEIARYGRGDGLRHARCLRHAARVDGVPLPQANGRDLPRG